MQPLRSTISSPTCSSAKKWPYARTGENSTLVRSRSTPSTARGRRSRRFRTSRDPSSSVIDTIRFRTSRDPLSNIICTIRFRTCGMVLCSRLR
eukprot:525103-Prorocentrum_minimum.AAC.1